MAKIYYNKLIRDRIPDVIENAGATCATRVLNSEEFKRELLKKLSEEVQEVLESKSKEELVSEIGDVLDVLEEIKKLENISKKDIQASREKAFAKKGGFQKRIFLEWSTDEGYKKDKR